MKCFDGLGAMQKMLTDKLSAGSLSGLLSGAGLGASIPNVGAIGERLQGILKPMVDGSLVRGPGDLHNLITSYLPKAVSDVTNSPPTGSGPGTGGGRRPPIGLPPRSPVPGVFDGWGIGPGGSGSPFDPISPPGGSTPQYRPPPDSRIFFEQRPKPMDNDSFYLPEWIERGLNPMLYGDEIDKARVLHSDIIMPVVRYYKNLMYGDPDYPTRMGKIIFGIVSPRTISQILEGSLASRHYLGEAVNFSISGVNSRMVVNDIASGAIHDVRVGTYALVNGIHASLPFTTRDGELVERMLLHVDGANPGYIGYTLT